VLAWRSGGRRGSLDGGRRDDLLLLGELLSFELAHLLFELLAGDLTGALVLCPLGEEALPSQLDCINA
jgi:hypothetical protein